MEFSKARLRLSFHTCSHGVVQSEQQHARLPCKLHTRQMLTQKDLAATPFRSLGLNAGPQWDTYPASLLAPCMWQGSSEVRRRLWVCIPVSRLLSGKLWGSYGQSCPAPCWKPCLTGVSRGSKADLLHPYLPHPFSETCFIIPTCLTSFSELHEGMPMHANAGAVGDTKAGAVAQPSEGMQPGLRSRLVGLGGFDRAQRKGLNSCSA